MVTKNDIVELVKQIFAKATLEGGEIEVETPGEFEPGAPLVVIGEEENVPAPDGEHKLEDGTVVTTKDGVIEEIVAPQVDGEVPEDKEELKEEEEVKDEDKMKFLEDSIAELVAKIIELEKKLEKSEEATLLIAEEFSKMPGGEKIELRKSGFNQKTPVSSTREQKLNELVEFIQKRK